MEGELLAIIEEGAALSPGLNSPQFGAYTLWCEKTAAFIGTVLGAAERQRFAEAPEQPAAALTDELAGRLARLRALRDRPKPWPLQVDARNVLRAAEHRRTLTEAERVVLAVHPSADGPPTPGRSPFPRSPLEMAVAESAIAAEDLQREATVRGMDSLLDAITTWAGETDQRLERANAGDLRRDLRADGIPDPGDTAAQLTYLDRQIRRLRRAWRELRRDEMTPLELLRERYELGRELRHTLPWLTGSPDTPEALAEADQRAERLACQWADETWRMLRQHYPGHERAFYGPDDPTLGLFALACHHELDQLGSVDKYLAAKLSLLENLLRAHGR